MRRFFATLMLGHDLFFLACYVQSRCSIELIVVLVLEFVSRVRSRFRSGGTTSASAVEEIGAPANVQVIDVVSSSRRRNFVPAASGFSMIGGPSFSTYPTIPMNAI
ncbi:uncharacterized protein K460DRAFT_406453 [Cucurbitaria berberidis CBS 394.84]|uniref:Uncharacterized protein n=1 Tax=Cucurbitaria berberidis CBS 394.84 TaxID=1168544 RepID=A0A9P4GJG2_9PLEO|nr:uncharacterized protein K460DRAFT_406453 [Cucurbitaria berberidis CBS 394.84]KAF1846235.1 hypothetical protein K460DRAFT_406453 [Cucurbitaria berberidis CBS 394.84]